MGQRHGLGIGGRRDGVEAPWYVAAKDMRTNTLVVTQDQTDLLASSLVATDANWLTNVPPAGRFTAKTRYRQPDQACTVITDLSSGEVEVRFDEPQRAVTPGQHVAIYDGDRCLGGARITAAHPIRSRGYESGGLSGRAGCGA